MNIRRLAGLVVVLSSSVARPAAQASVLPTVETVAVPNSGDAADDAVVWVHPTDPSLSTVIGTDKQSGLAVYDLAGNQLQFLPDGSLNNVDLRQGFPLGGSRVALVTSSKRNGNVLAIHAVDPSTRLLHDVAARTIVIGMAVYGCCMYRSPVTDDVYFFVTSTSGAVQQWLLFDDGNGRVDAALVRAFAVGSQSEGCVADDEARAFYVSEEDVGIWRYGAEPGDGTARTQVDKTGTGGHLTADVEGLSIYYASGGAGYLLASSQGSSTYVVYDRRPPHGYRLTFRIADNTALGIDGTSGTDGIDVMNLGLGSAFPGGAFVVQDDTNPGGNQNFKLVPWPAIASAANPPLIVDPGYVPGKPLAELAVQGKACRNADASYRNGSGINPVVLIERSSPVLGSVWSSDLDCAGHAPSTATIWGYTRPRAGSFSPTGESLVDTSSVLLFTMSAAHSGNTIHFNATLPPDPALCGLRIYVQALCRGAPGPLLSNAIDLRLGMLP